MTKEKIIDVLRAAEIIIQDVTKAGDEPSFSIDETHFNEYGRFVLKQVMGNQPKANEGSRRK